MPKPKKSLPIYSASQLKTWELCPRKWAWEYVAKFKPPATPAMLLGTALHKALERYYLEGSSLDLQVERGQCTAEIAEIAKPGLAFLPDRRAKPEVERNLGLKPPATRHRYRGFVDLSYPLATGPVVLDHKTTSAKKWALTPETMTTDLQVALYAREALERFPGTRTVDLRWVYYRTSGAPKAWVSRAVWSADEVHQRFDRVEGTADAVTDHRSEQDPLKYPYRPESCNAYGGCPHITRCNLSPTSILAAAWSSEHPKQHTTRNETTMDSLLDPAPSNNNTHARPGKDPSKVQWPDNPPAPPGADLLDPTNDVGEIDPFTDQPFEPPTAARRHSTDQPSLLPPEAPTGAETTKPMTLDEAENGTGAGAKKKGKKGSRSAAKGATLSEHAEVFTRLAVACLDAGHDVATLRSYWDEYKMLVVAQS